ncbi:MAG: hypothetical protein HYX69_16930 [Planctomycetia bacterium]|nr:hypothetical protein [Planctomycetia bacterium]
MRLGSLTAHRRMGVATCLLLVLAGCGRASETARDNRRLLDAILTAVTLKNPRELAKDEQLLEARHSNAELGNAAYEAMKAAITKAKSGSWQEAEDELYRLRETNPFPR